jgi:hypothetical protein
MNVDDVREIVEAARVDPDYYSSTNSGTRYSVSWLRSARRLEVEGTSEWVNGAPPARTRFEAKLERREVPRPRRAVALIADIAGGLMDTSSSGQPMFDTSRYRYRVRVIDRPNRTVVHDQNWKGDEGGARESLDHIGRDLDNLNVADFCKEYGVMLGSDA